jgi:dTDP-4-amino-4,6-dideoxygalactose transaminase
MKINYVDLSKQHLNIKSQLHKALDEVLDSGNFILGEITEKFEKLFASYVGVKHAIGVGSGTDALYLSLKALGIDCDDEVITVSNSYLATASSIALCGAKPVFIDVNTDLNIDYSLIEKAITKKTKAIIPVHLTGKAANMTEIKKIAINYNLPIVEDCAQAIGAKHQNLKVGSIGTFGCFSMHPLKNLNAIGDAGVITTNDDKHAEFLKKARNHGHPNRDECDFWSFNMRLDALQAAFLKTKMSAIDKTISKRRHNASIYNTLLNEKIILPFEEKNDLNVYHTYIIQTDRRDELKKFLNENGIETKIHYPTPIAFLKSSAYLGYKKEDLPKTVQQSKTILSLPVAEYITAKEIEYVSLKINEFFKCL